MRDVYEVLREKTEAMAQIRRELEALRSVSPLLMSCNSSETRLATRNQDRVLSGHELGGALQTAAKLLVDDKDDFDPTVRARLIEAGEKNQSLHQKSWLTSWLGSSKRSGKACARR
jgi:hypothetical protein